MSFLQKQYLDELKMELNGVQYSAGSSANKQNSAEETKAGEESLPESQQDADDAANLSTVLMSRKKRKLLEAMEVKKLIIFRCLYFDF